MSSPSPVLPYSQLRWETERLSIRPWTEGDAEQAFAIYGDPAVAHFLTGVPEESLQSQADSLRRIVSFYSRVGGGMGSFALDEKASGRLVGAVLLKPMPLTENLEAWRAAREAPETAELPPMGPIEIGWHLGKEHWGRGLATEAARRMLAYGFGELGLEEITAVLYRENVRSAAVAERLGMRHVGQTDAFYGVTLERYVLDAAGWNRSIASDV